MADFDSDLSSDLAVTSRQVTVRISLKSLKKIAVISLWSLCSAQALHFASKIKRLRVARVGARPPYGRVGVAALLARLAAPGALEAGHAQR
jgi:hypothetical protein